MDVSIQKVSIASYQIKSFTAERCILTVTLLVFEIIEGGAAKKESKITVVYDKFRCELKNITDQPFVIVKVTVIVID